MICGAVIYKASESDLNATDQRETGYKRLEVPATMITLQTGTAVTLQPGDKSLDLRL